MHEEQMMYVEFMPGRVCCLSGIRSFNFGLRSPNTNSIRESVEAFFRISYSDGDTIEVYAPLQACEESYEILKDALSVEEYEEEDEGD